MRAPRGVEGKKKLKFFLFGVFLTLCENFIKIGSVEGGSKNQEWGADPPLPFKKGQQWPCFHTRNKLKSSYTKINLIGAMIEL